MAGNINIVIGSWGSYNECNERALGSKWLDLSDYSDWDEIVEELKKEGFELDGIDEELFIQDVEGIEDRSVNWDYVNPETLFNTLKESGVLDDDYKYKVFSAFLEVRDFGDFEEKVNSHGDRWDDDINLWSGYSWEDYGREMLDCYGYNIPSELEDYIDYERYPNGHFNYRNRYKRRRIYRRRKTRRYATDCRRRTIPNGYLPYRTIKR